ncbi:MAG: keto-hydroxyglutarate-aldolase/keto-deoxy-phosphogluconate aldolase, partial [Alphaproteobacteria bacterium]
PGVASAGEMMRAAEYGFKVQKFFPAGVLGGPKVLKAVAGPLPDLRFLPTGGITAETAPEWLALAHVLAVGGSWIAPPALLAARDYAAIGRRLDELAQLSPSP